MGYPVEPGKTQTMYDGWVEGDHDPYSYLHPQDLAIHLKSGSWVVKNPPTDGGWGSKYDQHAPDGNYSGSLAPYKGRVTPVYRCHTPLTG
jgi:hypothetical protein